MRDGLMQSPKPPLRPPRAALIWLIVFVASLVVVPLALVFGLGRGGRAYDDQAPPPRLVVDGRPNLAAPRDFEAWWETAFPLRSQLVGQWNQLQQSLLLSPGSSRVMVGRDGWLFFAETLPDATGSGRLDDAALRRMATTLRLIDEYLTQQGVDLQVAVAPNKHSLYGEQLPGWLRAWLPADAASQHIERLGAILGDETPRVRWLDLLATLGEAQSPVEAGTPHTQLLYHALDSHWNQRGADLAYRAIARGFNWPAASLEPDAADWRRDWEADLARMQRPDRLVLDWQAYRAEDPQPYRFTRPVRSMEDVQFTSLNDAAEGHLYVYRDSFANVLVDPLSRSRGRVDYSRVVPYDLTAAASSGADEALILIAERNMNYWLQATPILPAPQRVPQVLGQPAALPELGLSLAYDVETRGDYQFLNARWLPGEDDETGRLIAATTQVLVEVAGQLYEAFPIHEDGSLQDDIIVPGFSLYLDPAIDVSSLEAAQVYVLADGTWRRITH